MTPQKCEQIREKVLKLLNAPIVEVLEKENYTIQKHLGKIIEGVDANEISAHFDGGKFGSNEWKYSKPLVAWGSRLGYLKELSAIMGLYPKNGNGDKEVKPLVVVNLQVNQNEAAQRVATASVGEHGRLDTGTNPHAHPKLKGEKQSQGQRKSRK